MAPPQAWLNVANEKCIEASLRLGEVGTHTPVDGLSREIKTEGLRGGGSGTRLETQPEDQTQGFGKEERRVSWYRVDPSSFTIPQDTLTGT